MNTYSRRQQYIYSSPDAFLVEKITKDYRVDPACFIECFMTVKTDVRTKRMYFGTLKELWQRGIAIKRYMEYPYVNIDTIQHFLAEINVYIQHSMYVIQFINKAHEQEKYIFIKDISMGSKKISIVYWNEDHQPIDRELSFDEYYHEYIESDHESGEVRVDIYDPVCGRDRSVVDAPYLISIIEKGTLSSMDIFRGLQKTHRCNTFKILREWFQIFKDISYQLLDENLDITKAEIGLYEADTDVSIVHLYKMMKTYNKLIIMLKNNIDTYIHM